MFNVHTVKQLGLGVLTVSVLLTVTILVGRSDEDDAMALALATRAVAVDNVADDERSVSIAVDSVSKTGDGDEQLIGTACNETGCAARGDEKLFTLAGWTFLGAVGAAGPEVTAGWDE